MGTPFLFVASDASDFIALPLVKREIEQTTYFDCTSVWGYPGPVASKRPWEIEPTLINYFQENLKQYMHDEKIVSVFSRMHPIIPQDSFFNNLGTITALNKTVAIDLKLPVELQRQQYRSSNKSEINQLRKKGYVVKKAETALLADIFQRFNKGRVVFVKTDLLSERGCCSYLHYANQTEKEGQLHNQEQFKWDAGQLPAS